MTNDKDMEGNARLASLKDEANARRPTFVRRNAKRSRAN
ncbi:hypothetical protein E24_00482 [Faustovirus]|nr:hypothetical protein E24_00482 [Faustovirus]AMN84378.1 hypothetical protein D5a_00480 [Faustovirus]AMN85365.1 hypothetical protein E23_00482 [Faustovirus]